MNLLITGGAGFIGSHLVDRLIARGDRVTVVDNFDPFYPKEDKERNIVTHFQNPCFSFVEADIRDLPALFAIPGNFDTIVHLAAKAGVRPSIDDPVGYQHVNVVGTQNLLELARQRGIQQFVFASSSSVYGVNPNVPWREDDPVLLPISPYASTKVSGELLGHVYSHLFNIRFLALRFFTVYGPRQRPDLAIRKFMTRLADNRPIPLFGSGRSRRDYTFVDDIVSGIVAATVYEDSQFEIINLGNNQIVSLVELIAALEATVEKTAEIEKRADQPGDVPQTWADISKAAMLLDYRPKTSLEEGLDAMWRWMLQGTSGQTVNRRDS